MEEAACLVSNFLHDHGGSDELKLRYDDLISSIEWNIAGKRNSSQQGEITLFVVIMDCIWRSRNQYIFLVTVRLISKQYSRKLIIEGKRYSNCTN